MLYFIDGTSGNDLLTGNVIINYIDARGGNDTINGGAGNDVLDGGAGNDSINGDEGDDIIYASNAAGKVDIETIDGGQGFDFLELKNSAETGNLIVTYTDGINGTVSHGTNFKNIESLRLYTGSGNDIINVSSLYTASIYANNGNDAITTGNGNDLLDGGNGNDTLNAGAGNDTLIGGAGNDFLNAGDGDDTIYTNNLAGSASLNIETIDGGQGFDYLSWNLSTASDNLTVTYNNPTQGTISHGSIFQNIESLTLYTGNGNDIIDVSALKQAEIYGGGGNNAITTGAGKDRLDGGAGNDTLNGGAGNDTIYGAAGNDVINGGDGDDVINASDGSLGIKIIDGGDGNDFLNWNISAATNNLTVIYTNSTNGTISNGSTFQNIENLELKTGSGNDAINVTAISQGKIYGNGGDDFITTGNGNDSLDGAAGNDTLNGGAGKDTLIGGAGNDSINGGDGDDTITASDGSLGIETIDGGQGFDSLNWNISAAAENLTVTYTDSINGNISNGSLLQNIESLKLNTGKGNDIIYVTAASNAKIYSNNGNDFITTGSGNDILDGGNGNDTLNGGTGNDTIYGRRGDDSISGDDGDDLIYASDGSLGIETIDGGQGFDSLNWNISAATANLTVIYTDSINGTVANGSTWQNIESLKLYTGNGNDTINVTAIDIAEIYGNAGNDAIATGNGHDILDGGDGDDYLNAAAGNDTLFGGAGNDTLFGGDGDDLIYGNNYTDKADIETIDGGEGYDFLQLDYSLATDNLTVIYTDSANGTISQGTTFQNIETLKLYTGSGNDSINLTAIDTAEIYGNSGNDSITTAAGNDILDGGDGDDILNAGAGDDTLDGGAGNDLINGGDGDDKINSLFFDDSGVDTIDGGQGNDSLDIYLFSATDDLTIAYTDNLSGSISNGTTFTNIEFFNVNTGSGNDVIHLSAAMASTVAAGFGNDSIITGDGNDYLEGGEGNDALSSGAGDDYIVDGNGIDTIDGGAGDDRLDLYFTAATDNLTITYINSNDGAVSNGTKWQNIELLYLATGIGNDNINVTAAALSSVNGGVGNDFIATGSGNDSLTGDDGNDTLNSGAGDDVLAGDYGNDILDGDAGDDVLAGGDGNDILNGGAGNDSITDGSGVDTINGGGGNDFLNLNMSNYIDSLTVTYTDSTNGTVSNGTQFQDIENLNLTTGSASDSIQVTAAIAKIDGGYGNDAITTGAGKDTLYGGLGNDTLNSGGGNDSIYDGAGVDSIDGAAGYDFLRLNLSDEIDVLTVSYTLSSNGTVSQGTIFQNIESLNLTTGTANDSINVTAAIAKIDGGYGNDSITTGALNDTLIGGLGNDTLNAGAGNDILNGGNGNDILVGGIGKDSLTGGTGNDIFIYNSLTEGGDTITDFNTSEDQLILTNLLLDAGYFASHAIADGYVRWLQSGTTTLIQIDIDGAAGTSQSFATLVRLNNVTATNLTASNFVFSVTV